MSSLLLSYICENFFSFLSFVFLVFWMLDLFARYTASEFDKFFSFFEVVFIVVGTL